MSAPTVDIGPVRPSFKAANGPEPTPEFGPDFMKTPVNEPKETKTTRQTRSGKEKPASPLGTLGQNKKLRSPVRKLTRTASGDELSDLEKLASRYRALGNMASGFHPKFAAAMEQQAEDCALSWFELAEQNDTVRRYILAVLEGGAWGGVIAAHTPIFLAVIPEAVLMKFFFKVMGVFAKRTEEETDEPVFPNWGPPQS